MSQTILRDDLRWFLRRARTPRVRSMREFAEAEVVIPDGPFAGRRFRCDRQPYTGLWFDAVDSGAWNRFVATGPTQSGKSLACFVIPVLYHLFESGETVVCGLPDMDMAGDKWREDLLPAIERSRYRDLLPRSGAGSRGGRVEAIRFRNGATLRFLSGGGGDKSRAGFTTRVVVITETDGLDRPGTTSRESDKVTQLEARTRAYGARKRVFMECTVSTEEGRTWSEYQAGTRSRIVLPCPSCGKWVSPEREHLVGWQEAESQTAAANGGAFSCPECGLVWSEEVRGAANREARLVHHGQSVDEQGRIAGSITETNTLGFRWSAVHNLFLTGGDVAADEWRARRRSDEELAERELRQYVWAIPVAPDRWDATRLAAEDLSRRQSNLARGIVPREATQLTMGVDLGKYLLHWIVVAWSERATGQVVDYGRTEVPSDDLGVEQGLLVALRSVRDLVRGGWAVEGGGENRKPDKAFVDAGWMPDVVYAFCREVGDPFQASLGRGTSRMRAGVYQVPTQTNRTVRRIGEGYHVVWNRTQRLSVVEVDADHWKSWVHHRLSAPLDEPSAMTLYRTAGHEHLSLAKHLTAEIETEEFVAGKGVVVRWERVRRNNHWFDALYNAAAAGHLAGVRMLPVQEQPRRPRVGVNSWFGNQSLAPFDTERWRDMQRRWNS